MAQSNPSADFSAITPSDATNLSNLTRGLYVGGAGNISAVTIAGVAVVFTAVPAGSVLPIQVKRINATGTTATALVGLY